jgi:hypothetical protein
MQETFFDRSFEMAHSARESQVSTQNTAPAPSNADLTRVFNAAVLSTHTARGRDFATELYQLVGTPAFESILAAIRHLASTAGISEQQACEQVIQTFRKIDSVWKEYAFQEGYDVLNPRT